jgi:biofilm PGA synthesis protein PgaD
MTRQRRLQSTKWRRATEFTITTLFWFAWLYLIMPFVSLLLWALGVRLFVDEMIVRGGYEALIAELGHYSLVVLVMLVATLVWVYWNVRRYGGHEKRTQQPAPVSLTEIAAASGLLPSAIQDIRADRRLWITFDDDDRPVVQASGKL